MISATKTATAAALAASLGAGVAIGQPARAVVVEAVKVHATADGCWTEQRLSLTVDGEAVAKWGEVYDVCDPALKRGPPQALKACVGSRPAEAKREGEVVGCAG